VPRTLSRVLLSALIALATALVVSLVAQPVPAQPADPVRIMALGDSITGSPGCWRALLWQRLENTGFTNTDFVGTLPPQGCGFPYDGENEGHGGFLATNVASQNQLVGWLSATNPDIVMMHFGTNDVWNARTPSQILAAFTTLVNQMRANNPAMRVLVAQIIPMNPSNCAECAQRVVALNNAIPGWAAGITTAQSPVVVVDQWTGFSTATDTNDGVHPNAAGDQKIANRWYPALTSLINGVPTSPPPTTSSPPPSSSSPPPPPPPGGCTATYRIIGQWQGGFQGGVVVTNTGNARITGWTVRFRFTNGQVASQSWGAQLVQTGPDVTAPNAPWNGSLDPAASAEFGFIASWNGANAVPNPVTCTPA
jgi:lysophospholipase L1-like esterase